MNNTVLLNRAFDKLSSNSEYIAYYFREYLAIEKLTHSDLAEKLQVDLENLFRLSLCKAPSAAGSDFISRVKHISEITAANQFVLASILRYVWSMDALKNRKSDLSNGSLLAARETEPDSSDDD